MSKEITLLIDGNNTLHRTYWIANNNGPKLINSKERNVGSVFTFLRTVKSYVEQFNADNVYIAWDRKTLPKEDNFRDTLTEGDYKGTRNHEYNKDVYADVDAVVEATTALGIKNLFPGKLEADDIISWLSKTVQGTKIIVSVDKDFIQLVAPDISYFNPVKKKLIDVNNFESEFDLTPREYLYFKAIKGDTSDNIPGIEGYGEVRSKKLAKEYYLYTDVLGLPNEHNRKVIDSNKELIENNLKLMDLSYGLIQCPEELELYRLQVEKMETLKADFSRFVSICEDHEFESILSKITDWQAVFNKKSNNNVLAEYFKQFE
jgi:DNA polymerase-1